MRANTLPQPPLTFAQDLKKPLFVKKPSQWGKRPIAQDEVDAHGIYLANEFCDDAEGLLQTVYADFQSFCEVYEIGGNAFAVTLKKEPTDTFEAYRITVTQQGVTVAAADTEGIRRGVIWIEDELRRRENAFLPLGTVCRRPWLADRISRCFFSPTNRPPKMIDELENDVDYYPDAYLNRLMHDGTNGIWIYTRFADLFPSTLIPEYGRGCERRLAKLKTVVEKCRRYGIGVYLFAIEPDSLSPELARLHPEMCGAHLREPKSKTLTFAAQYPDLYDETISVRYSRTVCMNTEQGRAYAFEAGKQIASFCPHLKGMISITYGERDTTCASVFGGDCPRCKGKPVGQLLAAALEGLRSGMRAVNPAFQFISWTYGHRNWETEDILDYVRRAPSDVLLMQNFDDNGITEQLGKPRLAIDYWLSYVGPSQMFLATAQQANESKKPLYAKMQVCCSHEIATVPYVPAPSLVYQKYKQAKRLGVSGILQCWYMGNYPCLMSKAAGELAFMQDFDDEDAFLQSLAAITWGQRRAKEIARIWKQLSQAYTDYPTNIMFSYYGPAHNGVVWELSLLPKNLPLPRSWLQDYAKGDRIGEALMAGHTLQEAITLLAQMSAQWREGTAALAALCTDHPDEVEQYSVAQAINVLFDSAYNILRFYDLRHRLGIQSEAPQPLLEQMEALVHSEIQNSTAMIALCQADNRLGYHSEAEEYRFFPTLLEGRIAQLNALLQTEFVAVRERIAQGKAPLAYYEGQDETQNVKRYALQQLPVEQARWEWIDQSCGSRFRMAYDDTYLYIELDSEQATTFVLSPEYQPFVLSPDIVITPQGKVDFNRFLEQYWSLFGKEQKAFLQRYERIDVLAGKGSHFLLTVERAQVGLQVMRPMKMRIAANGHSWSDTTGGAQSEVPSLGKPYLLPTQSGWIIP